MNAADREILYVAERIGRRLLRRGQFVTTAESCTGGWVAKALTDVAGSSEWFGEGFVTYSNEAKMRTLAVPRAMLKREGAVSEAVARAMAAGALERTGARVAVAVKPVGTVWFCWAQRRGSRVHFRVERKRFRGSREVVRRSSVRWALARLLVR